MWAFLIQQGTCCAGSTNNPEIRNKNNIKTGIKSGILDNVALHL